MSLRDLGVFSPLPKTHPAAGKNCWKCGCILSAGVRTALNPIETTDESGENIVRCEIVCATCHLKGKRVMTPIGARIVERIKEGDGSPFPVETTDSKQWRDEEINN